ncbi:MAG: DUF3990 domain-containing protein [Bacilli bacterium]|nr:DUF3990 domain-containing protein [Bacilli bacterium]
MNLFYGSKTFFQKPTFGVGNPCNDYGLGFYLTDSFEMAELWACQNKEGGFALSFSLDSTGLRILRLDDASEKGILEWITLLVKHRFPYGEKMANKQTIDWLIRHFDVPVNQYDMIVGYRADDSYFNYSLGFVTGQISLETLAKAMKLGKLTLQYALLSQEAFQRLRFLNASPIPYQEDYRRFREKTLEEYHQILQKEDRFHNTFIGELMKKYGE